MFDNEFAFREAYLVKREFMAKPAYLVPQAPVFCLLPCGLTYDMNCVLCGKSNPSVFRGGDFLDVRRLDREAVFLLPADRICERPPLQRCPFALSTGGA